MWIVTEWEWGCLLLTLLPLKPNNWPLDIWCLSPPVFEYHHLIYIFNLKQHEWSKRSKIFNNNSLQNKSTRSTCQQSSSLIFAPFGSCQVLDSPGWQILFLIFSFFPVHNKILKDFQEKLQFISVARISTVSLQMNTIYELNQTAFISWLSEQFYLLTWAG